MTSDTFRIGERMVLKPSLEVAVRQDDGDAEVGSGLDIGGGLIVTDGSSGLQIDLQIRRLVMHQAPAFEEHGLSIAVSYDPTPATPLDVNAPVTPGLGRRCPLLACAGSLRRRLDGEVGCGLPVGSLFVGEPRVGFSTSEYGGDDQIGCDLGLLGKVNFQPGVDAQRRETAMMGSAENAVQGTATLAWLSRHGPGTWTAPFAGHERPAKGRCCCPTSDCCRRRLCYDEIGCDESLPGRPKRSVRTGAGVHSGESRRRGQRRRNDQHRLPASSRLARDAISTTMLNLDGQPSVARAKLANGTSSNRSRLASRRSCR